AYLEKGDNDTAIADYNEAIRLDPELAWAFNNRGKLFFYNGDYEKAAADLLRANDLNDGAYAMLWRYLAFGHMGQDRAAELSANATRLKTKDWPYAVIVDYNEAIRLDPELAWAFNNRGSAYALGDVCVAAVVVGHGVFRIEPDCLAEIRDGAVFVALGGVRVAAVVVGPGQFRIEPDRVVVVGDGAVVIVLGVPGVAAVGVGDGAVVSCLLARLDERGTTPDLCIPIDIRIARATAPFRRNEHCKQSERRDRQRPEPSTAIHDKPHDALPCGFFSCNGDRSFD